MTTAHDLLAEPLLSWRNARYQRGTTTLPGLLAMLGKGELVDFPRVRAHQFHPWSMFLTQLAAIALKRADENEPRLVEDAWRERLLALTDGAHEPWCLVVGDLAKAAFFQPPVAEGILTGWKEAATTPDDMDVLATAKAHDIKRSLVDPRDQEAWACALCCLQTMQGQYGAGQYGVARMNGGFATRVRVGVTHAGRLHRTFIRDLELLLETWDDLVESRQYANNGVTLVWNEPWDGRSSLEAEQLAPHFIEVCRRIRLTPSPQGIRCFTSTSTARRCLRAIKGGDVGDPWIPVDRDKATALNIGGRGFGYALTADLLFKNNFAPAAAQNLRPGDGDSIVMSLWGLARGQGGTEGLHERSVVLSGPVRRLLGQPDGRAVLGRRSSSAIQEASDMRTKVLFPALKQIALGGKVVNDQFDFRVDEIFFDTLFAAIEDDDDAARLHWKHTLKEVAWRELQSAIDRCSVPDARRYRAISDAERMFRGCLKKQFPDLFREEDDDGRGSKP